MSEQFFSVEHGIPLNVEPLPADFVLPTLEALEQELPAPFRIAGAITHVDVGTARQLRSMGEEFGVLVEVINQQSAKINLLLGYLLSQMDEPSQRRITSRFGGSGMSFHDTTPWPPGSLLRIKLFLEDEASAIYCYGRIVACHPEPTGYQLDVEYVRLRHDDQELLVRASLHVQSRQLKLRAEQRANPTK